MEVNPTEKESIEIPPVNPETEPDPESIVLDYPGLLVRVKSGIIDTFILILWIMIAPRIVKDDTLRIFIMLFPILLYEPVMISAFRHTAGQWFFKMMVLDEKDMGKVPFYLAVVRTIVKYLLGTFSFIYIFFSDKNKAIHDNAAGSIVIYDPDRIKRGEAVYLNHEEETDKYIYPSGLRRFVFFLIWYIPVAYLGSVCIVVIFSLFGSALDNFDKPTRLLNGVIILWYFVMAVVMVKFAINGLLPGAFRKVKLKPPESTQTASYEE